MKYGLARVHTFKGKLTISYRLENNKIMVFNFPKWHSLNRNNSRGYFKWHKSKRKLAQFDRNQWHKYSENTGTNRTKIAITFNKVIMESVFKNKVLYLMFFFCIVLLFTLILNNFYTKKEVLEEIYFVVDKIEETPALRCYYYDKDGSELILNSFTFYAPSEIQRGDVITKKANSSQLIIYRYDSLGKKVVYQIIDIK